MLLIPAVVALVAAPYFPSLSLVFGFALLALCGGAFLELVADITRLSEKLKARPAVGNGLVIVQDWSRRLIGMDSGGRTRGWLLLAGCGSLGLVLLVAGGTGAGFKWSRERVAAKKAAEEAQANAQVAALVKEAEDRWKAGYPALADEKLDEASRVPNATEVAAIGSLRTSVANSKVKTLVAQAAKALHAGDIEAGEKKVLAALAVPLATDRAEAYKLEQQIFNATDPGRIRAALTELSDEGLRQLKDQGALPARMTSGYAGLDRRASELARVDCEAVLKARSDQRQREQEEQSRREADARRQAEERARQEADAKRDRVDGEWSCVSEITGGEPVRPAYHKSWAFRGDRLTINGDRQLWYQLDTLASPKRLYVYNQAGNRRVNLYACIYKFEGGKLIVCFEAGDTPPTEFRASQNDTSFMLTFTQ